MALAERLLAEFEAADHDAQLAFLRSLASHFGADDEAVEAAIDAWRTAAEPKPLARLQRATEPRRQELIRRMNYAPGGTAALIRMREVLMDACKDDPGSGAGGCRFRPSLLVLVQSRLPRPASDRLGYAGQRARKADPLRGGA